MKHTNDEKLKYLVYWNIEILKCLVYWNIGPCKRLKIVLRCSGTVGIDDDKTLDLILQVHSDVLVSPLHIKVTSSPHDGELGTGSSLSVQLWLRCFWTSALSTLSSGVLSLGTFSSRHWLIFLILIFRGNNQSLLEAVASREGNNFLIGRSSKSLAVVGRLLWLLTSLRDPGVSQT